MRNLAKYPVTHDEKISAVEAAIQHFVGLGNTGDVRPVALHMILSDLRASRPDVLNLVPEMELT